MKRNYIGNVSFALISLLFATTGAFAQSVVEVNVPFTFSASNTQLPAGRYQITEDHARQNIKVYNLETGTTILAHVQQETARGGARYKAVFHHFGNQYFLAEIREDMNGLDVTLPVTKQERKLQSMQVAGVPQKKSQEIEIALK